MPVECCLCNSTNNVKDTFLGMMACPKCTTLLKLKGIRGDIRDCKYRNESYAGTATLEANQKLSHAMALIQEAARLLEKEAGCKFPVVD